MNIPFFYLRSPGDDPLQIALDEDTSRHVVQVLRFKPGEQLRLTDGLGQLLTAELKEASKKKCVVRVIESRHIAKGSNHLTVAISLLKNTSRFEWFIEKATELGITEIIPLISERTEKQFFRSDRMKTIAISAMLQSQQAWLPLLREPLRFTDVLAESNAQDHKFIAHCLNDDKRPLPEALVSAPGSRVILIGPEGDFTAQEIDLALSRHFIPVSLGDTRLRTETAGMMAAVLMKMIAGN